MYRAYYNVCGNKKNYASAEIRQWSRVLKHIKRCLHDLILIDVYALERFVMLSYNGFL